MREEHVIVLVVGILALLFFWQLMRDARADRQYMPTRKQRKQWESERLEITDAINRRIG